MSVTQSNGNRLLTIIATSTKEHLLGQDCNSHNAGVGQHCEAAIAQLLRAWDLHLTLEMQGTVWSGLKCVDRITVFER